MPAQLVAYSGFSGSNYIREPYSADLDFGTGEFSFGAVISIPTTVPAPAEAMLDSPQLVTNTDFSSGSSGWALVAGASVVNGELVLPCNHTSGIGSGNNVSYPNSFTTAMGETYFVRLDARCVSGAYRLQVGSLYALNLDITAASNGGVMTTYTCIVPISAANRPVVFGVGGVVGVDSWAIDNVSIYRLKPWQIASREAATGPRWRLGVTMGGLVVADISDGTTTRIVSSSAAYNTNTLTKVVANYRAGRLALEINGIEVAATNGAPLLTLNNSNAVLTIGNSYALDAPFPGSITMLKLGATVPTPEQSLWMYEQERQMFRDGAQICLPESTTVSDLTYDPQSDKWIAAQSGNVSEWKGLVRTSSAAPSAGTFSKVESKSGIKLVSRATTSPGVDVSISGQTLIESLSKRAESAYAQSRQSQIFDFDTSSFTAAMTNGSPIVTASSIVGTPYIGMGVTGTGIPANTTILGINGTSYVFSANCTVTASNIVGQSTFTLVSGWTAIEVLAAGASKREGSTKDWTRSYDGFRETIKFAVSPGSAAWVQITARKDS